MKKNGFLECLRDCQAACCWHVTFQMNEFLLEEMIAAGGDIDNRHGTFHITGKCPHLRNIKCGVHHDPIKRPSECSVVDPGSEDCLRHRQRNPQFAGSARAHTADVKLAVATDQEMPDICPAVAEAYEASH